MIRLKGPTRENNMEASSKPTKMLIVMATISNVMGKKVLHALGTHIL
jgi:hypothetical protein